MLNWVALRLTVCLLFVAPWAVPNGPTPTQQKEPLSAELSRDDLAKYAYSLVPGAKALPHAFKFPKDVRSNTVYGIDVSHYQGYIDWPAIPAQGLSFVYIKATQGENSYDPQFVANWKGAGAAAGSSTTPTLYRGAYHFMTANDDPEKQAKNFLETIGHVLPGDLPPCLDLEWDLKSIDGHRVDQWAALSSPQILERVNKWLALVEAKTNRRPIIYTNAIWWRSRIGSDLSLASYKLWIADYASMSLNKEAPDVPNGFTWSLWQLTDSGVLTKGGIPHHVDTTMHSGDLKHLLTELGMVVTAPH